MAVLRAAGKLLAVGHGGRRSNLPLRPPFWPSRDPLLPPITPVLSVLRLANPSPLTELADELSPPSMAEPRRSHCSGRQTFSLPPTSNPNRPSRDQRPPVKDTPSRVILHKSPWTFLSPNPQSKTYFPECAISIRKRKLHGLSQKYAFSIYRNAIRTVSLIKLSF